jgi:hypothetical protein
VRSFATIAISIAGDNASAFSGKWFVSAPKRGALPTVLGKNDTTPIANIAANVLCW